MGRGMSVIQLDNVWHVKFGGVWLGAVTFAVGTNLRAEKLQENWKSVAGVSGGRGSCLFAQTTRFGQIEVESGD
ncbi:hypothetical protein U1Q18_017490 [Sarracenia purpurea var. burkii]